MYAYFYKYLINTLSPSAKLLQDHSQDCKRSSICLIRIGNMIAIFKSIDDDKKTWHNK